MESLVARLFAEGKKRVEKAGELPLTVAIMGQTGVGKSSLINALFNTHLKTDPVRPCTKEVATITVTSNDGKHTISFSDLPGIGESDHADATYMSTYLEYLLSADVVLWAISADNRSTSFDGQALRTLLAHLDQHKKNTLLSKITFVLTKADVLTPPSWILADMGAYGIFSPMKSTRAILDQKEGYFADAFLKPYGEFITARTYNHEGFNLAEPQFTFDDHSVFYQGLLTPDHVASLAARYPAFAAVFERLYDNYRVISCSALFRYNLVHLLVVILNKLGPLAVSRFEHFVTNDEMNHVAMVDAKQLCNLIIVDPNKNRRVFDLHEDIFPHKV